MKLRDLFYISLLNTLRNSRKTLCSSLAIAIGIASLVLISAVGKGTYGLAEEELSRLGIDGLSLRLEDTENNILDPSFAALLEGQIRDVQSAMPYKIKSGSMQMLSTTDSALVWGVGENMIETMDLQLLHGREILPADLAAKARVAVIDDEYAFQVYRRTNIVGKTLRLCVGDLWENYEVIGVIRSQIKTISAMLGTQIGAFAYVPYTAVNDNTGECGVDQIALRCKRNTDPERTAKDIEIWLSHARPIGEGRYVVENITGYLDRVKEIVRLIGMLVTAIGGISLVVAGIGVMNGMLAGIEERCHELGIYLAVGARQRDIVWNIILESIMVCVFGACAGCVLGIAGALTVSRMTSIPCSIGVGELLFAVCIAMVCGLLSGTLPAIKAARLDPIRILNR